jgi:hypothetical protein
MYVHAHLRYCEALAVSGDAEGARAALLLVNPIAVTDVLPQASLRQRNTYFSSSDAAFQDRYQASAEWNRVRDGTIAVDGGWRIYSSGPGLYTQMFVRHILGMKRHFGDEVQTADAGSPPPHDAEVRLDTGGRKERFRLPKGIAGQEKRRPHGCGRLSSSWSEISRRPSA